MEYDERVPKPFYVNSQGKTISTRTFVELMDGIAEYGQRFERFGINYGGYAVTFVNGTALCQSHALVQASIVEKCINKSSRR
jgi:hypothetical protein